MLPLKPDYITDFGGDKKDYTTVVNYLTDRSALEVNRAMRTTSNVARVSPIIRITISNLFESYPDTTVESAFAGYSLQANPISLIGSGEYEFYVRCNFVSLYDGTEYLQTNKFNAFMISTNSSTWRVICESSNYDPLIPNQLKFTFKTYVDNSIATPSDPDDVNLKIFLTLW